MKSAVLFGVLVSTLCLPLAGCSREMGPDSDVVASQWENQFLRDFASANGLVSPSGTGGYSHNGYRAVRNWHMTFYAGEDMLQPMMEAFDQAFEDKLDSVGALVRNGQPLEINSISASFEKSYEVGTLRGFGRVVAVVADDGFMVVSIVLYEHPR
ncbi:MAG: hypothetical protein EA423_01105 [Phycisphaerales bacterium]|nr:MAG: hypothetical protein EA423_01105 [Phycisphaerales bacterium]